MSVDYISSKIPLFSSFVFEEVDKEYEICRLPKSKFKRMFIFDNFTQTFETDGVIEIVSSEGDVLYHYYTGADLTNPIGSTFSLDFIIPPSSDDGLLSLFVRWTMSKGKASASFNGRASVFNGEDQIEFSRDFPTHDD